MKLIAGLLLIFMSAAAPVHAAEFARSDDIIGKVQYYQVQKHDTLYEIARNFDVGIVELLSANPGVDVWQPAPGKTLIIPTMHILPDAPRKGIVLNLSELRLFYYAGGNKVFSFPIGIGREGWQTPIGSTKIVRKQEEPDWFPPDSILAENPELPEIVPAGPDNPLGDYALYLDWRSVLIHGTNRPYGVGKRSSHGCIRLYPEDIARLFSLVRIGTLVTVVDQHYKLGWQGNNLYLEVLPTQMQGDFIAMYQQPAPLDDDEIEDAVREFAGEDIKIDWDAVRKGMKNRNGIPVIIGTK